jgi:hypothetical protein
VQNPDYWDYPNDPHDPADKTKFVSTFSDFSPTVSVGEGIKPSFKAYTSNIYKARVTSPFYETYNITVSAKLDWYTDYTFTIESLAFKVHDECLDVASKIQNMTYPAKTNWTWDSVDEDRFNSGYLLRDPISNYSLPRLTPTLGSSRNFFTTCGKITYTVINPDYWDPVNDPNDPEDSTSFVSMFTKFYHNVLVGESTKPSFLAFTGNSLKAKI